MKIKNLLIAGLLTIAPAAAWADTYAVWPEAGEGETQIPNEFNGWYNFNHEVVDDNGVSATKCWMTISENESTASSGWMTLGSTNFDFALLAPQDLTFLAKVEGPGKWAVRLTGNGPEHDCAIEVPADGEYHKVRMNVQECFPNVYEKWAAGESNGSNIFTFALVGSNLTAESAIYFTNVKYVDAVAMPSVEANVTDITANSANLTYAVTFPEGYTDTTVTVNGEAAETSATLALTGLDPKTNYTYTIVATGTFGDDTFTKEKLVTFKTLRVAGDDPVWYGTTEKEGFSVEYDITYNPDKTLTVNAIVESDEAIVLNDYNFHMFIPGDSAWLKLYDNDNSGVFTGTTVDTFEEGTRIDWEWYLVKQLGGVYQESNTYVVGSENEAPLSLRVKASAQNVEFDSAEIVYTVTAPADTEYTVYYKAGEAEAVAATENPIKLTGLTEKTEYAYEVYAVAGELESRHVTVTFKTPAENAEDLVYADLFDAEFKNAFLVGEDESMRRSIYVTLPWKVTYTKEGTGLYQVDLSAAENVVGLVPQIWYNGFQNLTKNADTGMYEYNFGAQEEEAEVAISHYFAYSGGAVDSRTPYTNWGMTHELPEIGEAVSLVLSAAKETCRIGDKVLLCPVAKDANGHYLNAAGVTYESSNKGAKGDSTKGDEFDGNYVILKTYKGIRTITATMGDSSAETKLYVLMSNDDTDNVLNTETAIYHDTVDLQEGKTDPKELVNGNENSEFGWYTTNTEEHYITFDLGKFYYVEAIDILFEGARAKDYTVTLSTSAPAGASAAQRNIKAFEQEEGNGDMVITVEGNGENRNVHIVTPTTPHHYVTLATTATEYQGTDNHGDWGLKLKQVKVYGSEQAVDLETGVEGVVVSDDCEAPVEYYNLNGIRVSNPENGIFVRRQGSKVSKVLVK